jgi:pilus assembly protein Flp/PilA
LSTADLITFRLFSVFRSRSIKFNTPQKEAGLQRTLLKFLSDESGATAIEYGLLATGISIAIIAAVNGLGTTLTNNFNAINTSLK